MNVSAICCFSHWAISSLSKICPCPSSPISNIEVVKEPFSYRPLPEPVVTVKVPPSMSAYPVVTVTISLGEICELSSLEFSITNITLTRFTVAILLLATSTTCTVFSDCTIRQFKIQYVGTTQTWSVCLIA